MNWRRQKVQPSMQTFAPGLPAADDAAAPLSHGETVERIRALQEGQVVAGVARREVTAMLTDVEINATELLRATASVRGVMEQVELSVGHIAVGAQEQSRRLTDAAEHARESAAASHQMTGQSEALAQAVSDTAAAAREGSQLLSAAEQTIGGLGTVMQESGQAVDELASLSSQVGALVDRIAAVAKQSNLLALNAAIEAARAGTAGRGFAVVADEMRKLSTRAAEASAEAAQLIGRVTAETARAGESMTRGRQQVESGTATLTRVIGGLGGILERTAGLESGVLAISAQTKVAGASAVKLAGLIAEVASVSAETTAEAEQMATGVREASGAVKAISHVARHYAQMPAQLRAALVPVGRTLDQGERLAADLAPLLPEAPVASPTATGEAEVRYADWQPWENCRKWWRLDAFAAAHPAIHIRHLHLSDAELTGQLALPEVPDVTWAAPDWAPQLLQPIDDLLAEHRFDLSTFVPGVVESLRRAGGGKIYGLPMHLNMPLMVYNKQLFDRAGVPYPQPGITWEKLLPQLDQISQATGCRGLEIDMRNAHFLPFALHFLSPVGAALMDDAGSSVNAHPAVEAKLGFFQKLATRYMVPYEELWAPVRPFVEGRVAVLIGSTATLLFTPIREMSARGELSFTPEVAAHPVFASHPGVAPAPNFHVLGIHRFARHRAEAWRLLRHLVTDQERMRGDILRWGQAPVQYDETVRAAYAELGRQGAPTAYRDLWAIQTAPMPPYIFTAGFRRLEAVAGHEMAQLMSGQKSPAELLQALSDALARS